MKLCKHNDPDLPGFETMTLLVDDDAKVDKYGYYKKGVIKAQFFGVTIGEAEEFAEYVLDLIERDKNNETR